MIDCNATFVYTVMGLRETNTYLDNIYILQQPHFVHTCLETQHVQHASALLKARYDGLHFHHGLPLGALTDSDAVLCNKFARRRTGVRYG